MIAKPIRVSFACFRKTDDGSGYCFTWRFHARIMQGLDRGFECDAQKTRGLWIEPLPIQKLSEWHDTDWLLLAEWGGRAPGANTHPGVDGGAVPQVAVPRVFYGAENSDRLFDP
jgi:hypothetical protein